MGGSYEQEVNKFSLEVRIVNWQNVSEKKKKNDTSHNNFLFRLNMEAENNNSVQIFQDYSNSASQVGPNSTLQ